MRKGSAHSHTSSSVTADREGGESVKVCVRTRPLNDKEVAAGFRSCISTANNNTLQISLKNGTKSFRYNRVMGPTATQSQMFSESGVHVLLDSALQGYSASMFAYGQTGSGKTYTMAGKDENLGRQDYVSDETDGIIPRAISYLWQQMASREETYYVKAGFMEIYNEQIRDLLHPSSGVLHCRWNIKSGFFVEDLLIVDCTNIDDLIAVLHEGIRNRKRGVHDLNNDSSRSHSILITHLISEVKTEDGHSLKKFGKISFVDLAGSERLKESNSQGVMIKETQNINRSLFALGKVISALGDKKKSKSHIPYRDSKLTMLLMDSLGGTAKALMIACITPADAYADESLSTLNYAARTMNIKNKPVMQMDTKEQVVYNLRREIHLLKLENEYLKEQLNRVSAGMPPLENRSRRQTNKLPPIQHPQHEPEPAGTIMQEYHVEIERLQRENQELKNHQEVMDKLSKSALVENHELAGKLQNLEHVFNEFANAKKPEQPNNHTISNVSNKQLINENINMKRELTRMEQEKAQLHQRLSQASTPASTHSRAEANDVMQIKQMNTQLQKRIEFLQKREKDLLEHLMKAQAK